MKYKFFIATATFFCVFSGSIIFAQTKDFTSALESITAETNENKRIARADSLNLVFYETIKNMANADSLPVSKRVSQLFSKDKKTGVYTWCVPTIRGAYKYYGIVKSENTTTILEDTENAQNEELNILTNGKWIGAIYYQIIEIGVGGKRYYTLLGNKLQGAISNKKIVEILSFNNEKTPIFGADIFEEKNICRIIFEYNSRTSMFMRYLSDKKMICYNYLVPMNENFKNDKRFYIPDISYDGLIFINGIWKKVENVNIEKPEKTE